MVCGSKYFGMKSSPDQPIKHLVPVYHMDTSVLVSLDLDYNYGKAPDDVLVIDISLKRQEYKPPWGIQLQMKWDGGYWLTIEQEQTDIWLEKINSTFTIDQISEMVRLLTDPSPESLRSLIWIPQRLRYRIDNELKHKTDDSRF